MVALSLVVILGLIPLTWYQWRDLGTTRIRFWTHAINHGADTNSWEAHGNLGLALYRKGDYQAAAYHFADPHASTPATAMRATTMR